VETENYSNTWTTPELYAAGLYDADKKLIKTSQDYLTFLKLTNFGTKKGIEYSDSGELFFNADYINTGTLTVSKNNEAIFAASMGGVAADGSEIAPYVTMGGWNVDKDLLFSDSVGLSGGNDVAVDDNVSPAKIYVEERMPITRIVEFTGTLTCTGNSLGQSY
jgi:hypothetical protein